MREQVRLAPQIQEYQSFVAGDTRWVPYLMFFNHALYRSATLNTDRLGFRLTHTTEGVRSVAGDGVAGDTATEPVSLLMGGSTPFGFGASSDEHTLASRLSFHRPGSTWLPCTGTSLNSTQDTLLYLLHRHDLPEVRDIVVVGGMNNLAISGLPLAPHDYQHFFMSGPHFRQMSAAQAPPRRGARKLLERFTNRRQDPPESSTPSVAERVDIAVEHLRLDLDRLLSLTEATTTRLHFALQPTAPWSGKRASPEETALFEELDRDQANVWELFDSVLTPQAHSDYASGIAQVCRQRDIPFVDLNHGFSGEDCAGRWLFVDRVHLTDEGNDVAAAILLSELDLA